MKSSIIPAIREAHAEECYIARIIWEDGTIIRVDLREWLHKSKWFAPVLADEAAWKSLRVGGWGGYIEWDGCEMEIPSIAIENLTIQEA